MKKTLTFLMATTLCLFAAGWKCPAQDYVPTPVTVSTDKVKQNGKLYYAHIVLERQTLFSIAKAYGVSVDDIYAANAGLKDNGLKTNSIILIPATGTTNASGNGATGSTSASGSEADNSANASASESGADGQASETGQTSGELSQDVKVSVDEPQATAQDADSKAGTGKSSKKASRKAAKADNTRNYFIHTVKWYEDIDGISEKYGVSTAIIMDFNGLTSKKLKTRQQLRIPTNPEEYDVIDPSVLASAATGSEQGTGNAGLTYSGQGGQNSDSASGSGEGGSAEGSAAGSAGNEGDGSGSGEGHSGWGVGPGSDSGQTGWNSGSIFNSIRNRNKFTASLLLPFNASDTLSANELSMDFYSGALLAAKNLSDEGFEINLNTFDTYGDALPLTDKELMDSDLVIGLLSTGGFSSVLDNVSKNTYVVSPLDYRTESLAGSHSNFISCSNSMAAQYEDLARWIGEDIQPGDSVVVIYESGVAGQEMKKQISAILSGYDYSWTGFSYAILEGRDVPETLGGYFTEEGMNRVLVASENEAFVNDVIRNLNLLIHNKYEITLYGGSKIRSFENVDVANLHNTHLHSSLTFYIDYESPKVREFLMQYRALYNTEPSQTAFQGYDTMWYFATMLRSYGSRFGDGITTAVTPMLMSDFRFSRAGEGLIRTAVRRIVYRPDFSVTYIR